MQKSWFIAGVLCALVDYSAALAEGGQERGGNSGGRVGVSVDRQGLHVRVTVGNPQTLDVTVAGGIFRQRNEQIVSPINQQGFHGVDGPAHGVGAPQGGNPGGHGEY